MKVLTHSSHKGQQALLRSAKACSLWLHISQVQLLGQPISVGRPSGYVDPTTASTAAAAAAAALAAFQVLLPDLDLP